MKKLLFAILALISSTAIASPRTVQIVWPFAQGSNQVNFTRAIIDEAHKQQSKYTFTLEFRSGAGGAVAAQHVIRETNQLNLLQTSSSFFVRPVLYPNESYKTEDFRPIYIQCTGQPMAILSAKYKTIDELRQQRRLTIGLVAGVTEAAGRQLRNHLPNTQLDFVHYGGSLQAVQDAMGGTVDLAISWTSDTKQFVEAGRLNVIGTSGTRDFDGYKSFHSQRIKGFEELVGNYVILAPGRMSDQQAEELHILMRKAAQASTTLNRFYESDVCAGADLNWKQTQDIYRRWQQYWPNILQNLNVNTNIAK